MFAALFGSCLASKWEKKHSQNCNIFAMSALIPNQLIAKFGASNPMSKMNIRPILIVASGAELNLFVDSCC